MIIKSVLDNDLYKFSMMNCVLELFPNAIATYKFKNRGKQKFNEEFLNLLKKEIKELEKLRLTNEEYLWLKNNFKYFTPGFVEYLRNFRYDFSGFKINLTKDNDLELEYTGKWVDYILYEVKIMAIISELYFRYIDTDWIKKGPNGMDGLDWVNINQKTLAYEKIEELSNSGCTFAEFGTRRRRSHEIQDLVINQFVEYEKNNSNSSFVGTSNLYFAMKYNIKAIGTYAHELCMGMSVLEGLRNSNYYTMHNWKRVFGSNLGIALTDTYGTDVFLENFTLELAKNYDGVRHDSGCPFEFTDKIVNHYKKMNIDPMSKVIVFSDGLNIEKAIDIKKYCEGKIKCSFGIGTFMTNNIPDSPSLNMVIKLWSINGIPVVKLSDTPSKAMGDKDAIRVAKWTFFNQSLD